MCLTYLKIEFSIDDNFTFIMQDLILEDKEKQFPHVFMELNFTYRLIDGTAFNASQMSK